MTLFKKIQSSVPMSGSVVWYFATLSEPVCDVVRTAVLSLLARLGCMTCAQLGISDKSTLIYTDRLKPRVTISQSKHVSMCSTPAFFCLSPPPFLSSLAFIRSLFCHFPLVHPSCLWRTRNGWSELIFVFFLSLSLFFLILLEKVCRALDKRLAVPQQAVPPVLIRLLLFVFNRPLNLHIKNGTLFGKSATP